MKWTDSLDIAIALEEKYPNVDIVNLRYKDFHAWIIGLEGFNDEPNKSNEAILEKIHSYWLEERGIG